MTHALFRMVKRMRAITEDAAKTTRRARRDTERRRTAEVSVTPLGAIAPPPHDAGGTVAAPFSVVEEW